jgi:hypothetical protein
MPSVLREPQAASGHGFSSSVASWRSEDDSA